MTEKIVPLMALIYVLGAITVISFNLEQIGPSFIAIFSDVFSGTAATGGFLGASFAYAFSRGVNRGLFSNEAGQGSAPIAHAAARADEPISEGMVSILEPFIDTIVICTITGLVILSSGVWTEKFENNFQTFDTEFVLGRYDDANPKDQNALFVHLNSLSGEDDPVQKYTGTIDLLDGVSVTRGFTILHNRSIAERVTFLKNGRPLTGDVEINEGILVDQSVTLKGYSLIHSVKLTTKAFTRGFMGEWGQYIVSIGLVLFAFSTAVAWSYYGDRAMTYLFGVKSVMPYRVVYVIGFFVAAVSDTSLVWLISAITLALMTIPNLVGILMLHIDMKEVLDEYWEDFNRDT